MLILTRKLGEQILIGDDIMVTVVRITNQGVRLGIEASPESSIEREELVRPKSGPKDEPPATLEQPQDES